MKFEEVEAYLHYYAKYFQVFGFEHWDLVNAAWLSVSKQDNPKYASAGIRWAMQKYMYRQNYQRNRVNSKAKKYSLETEIDEDRLRDTIAAKIDNKRRVEDENNEFLCDILVKSRLNNKDKTLLVRRFYQGLEFKEIARLEGVSRMRIYQRMRKVLAKIRRVARVA